MLATHTVTNSVWLRNSIASETKTGNNTAVNRPTPSKPFGNDSAIEMSAHAVGATPSVRAALMVSTIDAGSMRKVEGTQQCARRCKFLDALGEPAAGKDRRLEEVIPVAHVAGDSRRAVPADLPRV